MEVRDFPPFERIQPIRHEKKRLPFPSLADMLKQRKLEGNPIRIKNKVAYLKNTETSARLVRLLENAGYQISHPVLSSSLNLTIRRRIK